MLVIVGIRIFAIPDALIILMNSQLRLSAYRSKYADLILSEKSITAASEQHHGHQEWNKGFERHFGDGDFSVLSQMI
jgi:hypothetical protein